MDDLLQTLKDHAAVTNITGGYPVDKPTLTSRAADEITALRARLEAVEKERDNETIKRAGWELEARIAEARAERAEAALATARRDALEEAATLADGFMVDMMNAALSGLPEQARLREAMANTAERIRIAIRALKDTPLQEPKG